MTNKTYLRVTLILFTSIIGLGSTLAQNKSKIYFSEFGFSLFTDYFSSGLIPFTKDYPFNYDANGSPIYSQGKGHVKFNNFGFASLNYTPRFNLYEIASNKSISIESHITLGFGVGFKSVYITSVDSISNSNPPTYKESHSSEGISIFSFASPIFISYNYGLGSTYDCDAERGFNVGIGLDMIHPMVWIEKSYSLNEMANIKNGNFYFLPAISLGYRKWKQSNATDINLKIGYWPSNETNNNLNAINSGSSNGLSLRLSYNKILNF